MGEADLMKQKVGKEETPKGDGSKSETDTHQTGDGGKGVFFTPSILPRTGLPCVSQFIESKRCLPSQGQPALPSPTSLLKSLLLSSSQMGAHTSIFFLLLMLKHDLQA